MHDFFEDLLSRDNHFNHPGRIRSLEEQARNSDNSLLNTANRVGALEDRLGRMLLANQAMWELMRDKLGISEAELLEKMKVIDLRDGVKDGKITAKKPPAERLCSQCGRRQPAVNTVCAFCSFAFGPLTKAPPRR